MLGNGNVFEGCVTVFSPDEVAEFLLYVKSLDYKDTPDYQLLKCLLSCSGGDLDFSPPRGPASESTSRTEEPQPRNKVSPTSNVFILIYST